jgi:hypothetical protein
MTYVPGDRVSNRAFPVVSAHSDDEQAVVAQRCCDTAARDRRAGRISDVYRQSVLR